MIFDGGSGLRPLGLALAERSPVDADLFFSHCHSDHICGLPFFVPCRQPATHLRLWAGNLLPKYRLEQTFRRLMSEPLFPIGLEEFKASIKFHDFRAGDVLKPHPDVTLRTAPLNHPGGAVGYRLEYGKHVIAYICDTEHKPGHLDQNVLWLADGADLMIYDGNFTEEEFPARVGWGHSTWEEGVRLARAANVEILAIVHHDPEHDDQFLDRVAARAKAARAKTLIVSEGTLLQF